LNQACLKLVSKKREAFGTPAFAQCQRECSEGLFDELLNYQRRTKTRLHKLKASSKKWWSLADSLLMRPVKSSSIPPLKRTDGSWAKSSEEKAEHLMQSFDSRSQLPDLEDNIFNAAPKPEAELKMCGFLPIRHRCVKKILNTLNETSATGPDGIPARILKHCSSSLALPIALLTRFILHSGEWPNTWRMHWLFPLYKRKTKSDPKNYRGIHLTCQLSKVIERTLGNLFQPFLQRTGAYGRNQFAYSSGKSYEDALASNTMAWTLAISQKKRVGLYCSDVSGAFDRVSSRILVPKLFAAGLHPRILKVLDSWLDERSFVVVVDGVTSKSCSLRNSVYQGTVWGPPLWNIFFKDARDAIEASGYTETVFADDMNAFKNYDSTCTDATILADLESCQSSLHQWGRANQVVFDASKESMHILSRTDVVADSIDRRTVSLDQ